MTAVQTKTAQKSAHGPRSVNRLSTDPYRYN